MVAKQTRVLNSQSSITVTVFVRKSKIPKKHNHSLPTHKANECIDSVVLMILINIIIMTNIFTI